MTRTRRAFLIGSASIVGGGLVVRGEIGELARRRVQSVPESPVEAECSAMCGAIELDPGAK